MVGVRQGGGWGRGWVKGGGVKQAGEEMWWTAGTEKTCHRRNTTHSLRIFRRPPNSSSMHRNTGSFRMYSNDGKFFAEDLTKSINRTALTLLKLEKNHYIINKKCLINQPTHCTQHFSSFCIALHAHNHFLSWASSFSSDMTFSSRLLIFCLAASLLLLACMV